MQCSHCAWWRVITLDEDRKALKTLRSWLQTQICLTNIAVVSSSLIFHCLLDPQTHAILGLH